MKIVKENGMDGQTTEIGWLDTIIKKLHLDKLNISSNRLIEIGMYLGFGFVTGFLLRRCAGYVFIAVLTLVGLFMLHQFGVITVAVDPVKMQQLFGIKQTVTIDTYIMIVAWEWIKLNMALVFSFVIGLLVGLKLG